MAILPKRGSDTQAVKHVLSHEDSRPRDSVPLMEILDGFWSITRSTE